MDILVLEDDDAIALGLAYSLKSEGFAVTVCKTVADALHTIAEKDFALHILDLTLPDDISKPFRIKELLARMKSVLRRCKADNPDGIIRLRNLEVRTNEAKVYKNGRDVFLTAMEYRLLLILLHNRGHILTRTQLLEEIWDVSGDFVNDNTLTVYIKRLRDKIEENSDDPVIIKTVRGLGYVIDNAEQ